LPQLHRRADLDEVSVVEDVTAGGAQIDYGSGGGGVGQQRLRVVPLTSRQNSSSYCAATVRRDYKVKVLSVASTLTILRCRSCIDARMSIRSVLSKS
jgi:hypothetical protein